MTASTERTTNGGTNSNSYLLWKTGTFPKSSPTTRDEGSSSTGNPPLKHPGTALSPVPTCATNWVSLSCWAVQVSATSFVSIRLCPAWREKEAERKTKQREALCDVTLRFWEKTFCRNLIRTKRTHWIELRIGTSSGKSAKSLCTIIPRMTRFFHQVGSELRYLQDRSKSRQRQKKAHHLVLTGRFCLSRKSDTNCQTACAYRTYNVCRFAALDYSFTQMELRVGWLYWVLTNILYNIIYNRLYTINVWIMKGITVSLWCSRLSHLHTASWLHWPNKS